MESVKILKDDVIQRLKNISKDLGVSPNQFLSDILDEYEEDKIFAERSMKALERVEADSNRKKYSKEGFIKELESW